METRASHEDRQSWSWSGCGLYVDVKQRRQQILDIVHRKGLQSHILQFISEKTVAGEKNIYSHLYNIIYYLFTIHLICKLYYVAIWNIKCNIMLLLLLLHLFIILFQIHCQNFFRVYRSKYKTAFVFVLYCCYEIWWGFQTKGKKLLIISVVNYKTCYILIQFVIIHWSVVFIQIQSISKSQWKQSILPLFCSSHSTLWFSLFQE